MRIEHVAIFVKDLEKSKNFYKVYFNALNNYKYSNPSKGFESYFLTFKGGCRLEIMTKSGITPHKGTEEIFGFQSFSFFSG